MAEYHGLSSFQERTGMGGSLGSYQLTKLDVTPGREGLTQRRWRDQPPHPFWWSLALWSFVVAGLVRPGYRSGPGKRSETGVGDHR